MATMDSILAPGEENGTQINDLAAVTASAIQTLGKNVKFVIVCTAACTIRFGLAAVTNPDAASFLIPANTPLTFDLGFQYDSFKVFNIAAAATADIHYLRLSHF